MASVLRRSVLKSLIVLDWERAREGDIYTGQLQDARFFMSGGQSSSLSEVVDGLDGGVSCRTGLIAAPFFSSVTVQVRTLQSWWVRWEGMESPEGRSGGFQ